MIEPRVRYATVRVSDDPFLIPIECRFDDGQKFSAVQVDIGFPELADQIAKWLSERSDEFPTYED